jgi:hypothetical protein
MGLHEKRVIKEYKENIFPKWKESFSKLVGDKVEIDVHWETMTGEGRNNKPQFYFDCWTKVYFKTLTDAFTEICKDDLGKEAVSEVLKKISISGQSRNINFKDGHLMMFHLPFTNVDKFEERIKEITAALDKAF